MLEADLHVVCKPYISLVLQLTALGVIGIAA
jgi:hypothetical protein